MRIILITHTDLDGASCILAFKELYKDYPGQLEYYCCNPDKSDKTFEKVINKYPLEIHKVIFADVPRNPTGKIEKPKLRKIYCGESLVATQVERKIEI